MRADAGKNYEHLLAVARDVIAKHGVEASLRDIARQADVGVATLFRHFPTREALLEVLLRTAYDELTRKAASLDHAASPDDALVLWLRDAVAFFRSFNGVVTFLAAALADPDTPLHASCTAIRAAGTKLLHRAQATGSARADLNGVDLFAMIGSLGWIGDQAAFAPRADHLFKIVTDAIFTAEKARAAEDRRALS